MCKLDSNEKNCVSRHSEATFLAVDSINTFPYMSAEKISPRRLNEILTWRLASDSQQKVGFIE